MSAYSSAPMVALHVGADGDLAKLSRDETVGLNARTHSKTAGQKAVSNRFGRISCSELS